MAQSHIYLIDASGYIFRAYHALPPLTRKSDALPVGAIAGFCAMLFKLLEESEPTPSHIAAVFDTSRVSFRNKIYADYKAHRPPPPEDLVPQFPLMRDAVRAFGLPAIEQDGYEADDIIATYARQAEAKKMAVTIVSSDKDLMQLIGGDITMLDTMKNRRIDTAGVEEKFGVAPNRVIDVQALAGDSSDNVPGVPGIGIKTAAELIMTYGDLDALLAEAENIKQPKRRENLLQFAEQARISRELVTLKTDVPNLPDVASLKRGAYKPADVFGFLKAMEFATLTKRVAERLGVNMDDYSANPAQQSQAKSAAPAKTEQLNLLEASVKEESETKAFQRENYACLTDWEALQDWIARAHAQGFLAVDTETTSLNAYDAELVGLSLALAPNEACYIPLTHCDTEGKRLPAQLPRQKVLEALAPLFQDSAVLKILHNAKYDLLVLREAGLELTPIDDTLLLSYVLDAGRGGHGLDALALRYLDHQMLAYKELVGTGAKQIGFAEVALDKATAYAAEDADATLRLWLQLKPRLLRERLSRVYETLERPLISALIEMEAAGVMIDKKVLAGMSAEFAEQLAVLEKDIHQLAGEEFNIASPAQLGTILFEKMALAGGSKTKTGAWSTSASQLESLAGQGHELPARVLEWRALAKLRSTYTEALPQFISPKSQRVHSSYGLASTSTGRLSSSDPNLQNIPIRTENGRRIRQAFIAPKGKLLVSADYSQIELRVLAHLADIPALKQAFIDGQDIHATTAAEMFGTAPDRVDADLRRRAKAINFGIIYGISAFGLANQLGISREEAGAYIKSYFDKFAGIKLYMDAQRERIRTSDYVETLFGRRIHYDFKGARSPAEKGFIERAAINAPIQGTAADIMRRAMIALPPALRKAKLNAPVLMQVHDELVLECAEAETEKVAKIVTNIMANATLPALQLSVPLVVDTAWGKNWDEAH